ncbi:multidrug effflux MFS transporter [Asticcacaulis sp. EMRT-3]|uniref:multidrug effflux MFS transporter n=1 Tax=Asticcacaulis sp. EMRT-3 TaxID=3040349 RepID=UPI0024AF0902|nr:multidrug effflux MFS transporter [Asticcacaulis sp. EMRT-3]MDI7776194.1 multidrug effflux MFS transporter [Asticcacaulis sp. EMRT-3]
MSTAAAAPAAKAPHFAEFVALIATMMALGALGIDSMLPALPVIGRDLHVASQNDLQWVISIYFMGLGVGQLIFGILSDWLGRKRVLLTGIACYVVLGLVAGLSENFTILLALRLIQGICAAASTVIARSIIRDLYSGRLMAKVTSLSIMVFLMAPVMAPSFGQLILSFAPWRVIFFALSLIGTATALWAFLRLPETLPPERRHRPDLGHVRRVGWFVITEPGSFFYTLAIMFLTGALLAYVSLMPQIFTDVFHKPALMAIVFACCAGTMGVASLLNASLVERLGMKRISHATLSAFIVLTFTHFLWAVTGHETVLSFLILQSATMGMSSLSNSNFTAVAMDQVGHVAGTAASIQGVVTMVGGGLVASLIGQGWNGGVWLLPLGALLCGLVAMTLVVTAEKGRLYRN